MRTEVGETTDGALLERLGDWADHDAWAAFIRRYDRAIRRGVAAGRFQSAVAEDLCQRIWIELAGRMRGYRYDPSRRFRGWLGRLCRSRMIDEWRRQRAKQGRTAVADPDELEDVAIEDSSGDDLAQPSLLSQARQAQEAVRARVDARTWEVFWRIAVEDAPIRDVAESAGLSYAAAFAAQKRVRRMLREEAAKLSASSIAAGEITG